MRKLWDLKAAVLLIGGLSYGDAVLLANNDQVTSVQIPNATVQGSVSVVGSAVNAQTKLMPTKDEPQSEPSTLCRSGEAKRIGRVAGMYVIAEGHWSQNPVTKERCFEVKGFRVTKSSSGRPALVGRLIREGELFFVLTSDGKKQGLNAVPGGLSKLEGKEVIIDVKPIENPVAASQASWRVVSYAEHP